jgi:hypothetical protein
MALTEAEQLELAQLESEVGGGSPAAAASGLTPDEAQELAALEAELSQQAPQTTTTSTLESDQASSTDAALQGFGSAGTLGYLPRLQAGVEAALDPDLTYKQALPHWQQRDQKLQTDQPGAYLAGNLAGSVATPIPGMGAIKTGGLLAKTGKAALQGAALSGATDTGLEVGSMADLKARLERAGTGSVMAGGLQGLGSSIAKIGPQLKQYGTFKLLGARGKDAEKLLEKNKAGLRKTEEFLDKEGIVGPLTTNADLAKRADKIQSTVGAEIGKTYDKVQGEALDLVSNTPISSTPEGAALVEKAMATRLDPKVMADEFMSRATQELEGTANGDQILRALKSQINNLKKVKTEKGVSGIVEFRKSLDDALKKSYERPAADLGEKQEAMMTLRRYIKDRTNDHIGALDNLVGSDSAKALTKLNDRYANASTVKRITGKSEIAQMRNNMLGLPELIVGGATGGAEFVRTGDPNAALKGLAAGAAFKLSRSYSPAMAYSAGKALNKAPSLPVRTVVNPWMTMNKEQK